MTYVTGALAPVPTDARDDYLNHVDQLWQLFQKHGALRMVDCWGVDLPKGKQTDFQGAVDMHDGESVTFSWIEWPDKQTRESAMTEWETRAESDERYQMDPGQMPFDGKRMIYGGFEPIVVLNA